MSDTPLTDEAAIEGWSYDVDLPPIEFTQDLERKLAQAKALLEECRYALVTSSSNTKSSRELRDELIAKLTNFKGEG